MVIKISDIAKIQGGIVLGRKEAKNPDKDSYIYKRLTLRALNENGYIVRSELEDFPADESLRDALFTHKGDVVVRLTYPLFPTIISEGNEGLLVPSQIAVLQVKDPNVIIPEYLRLYLAQKDTLDRVQKIESGTAQRTVKIGTILNLPIMIPDIEVQCKVVAIDELSRKREQLYRSLIEQERFVTENVIENVIGGKIK